jgi:hypothetical protein
MPEVVPDSKGDPSLLEFDFAPRLEFDSSLDTPGPAGADNKGNVMTTETNTTRAAPMSVTLEQMAQAFEAWENGFRAAPERFLTTEECAALNVSTLSADRASYFRGLLPVCRWCEAEAVAAAHAAGFAGTHWTMGPEELVHLLNMVNARPSAA